MKALDQGLRTRIGLWVEPLMRVPVAGKETFEAQNIGMIRAADDHRPAGTPIEKADTAKDQGAHDAFPMSGCRDCGMISLTGGRAISGYGRSAANPLGPQIQFASESFIDEIAAAIGTDPVAFRLPYLKAPHDIWARLPPERPQRGPPSSPPPSPGAGGS